MLRFSIERVKLGRMQKYIYHEVQESALCGQHCLNNLLQGPFFTAVDLATIAQELDHQERMLGNQDSLSASANVDNSGNFSIQVLRKALQSFSGIDLRVWFQKSGQDADPTQQKGFIVNRSEHWIAIRKIHGKWWNLNSTNERPELVSEFYLGALLQQLRNDNFIVFIADGHVPEQGDPDRTGLYGSSAGKWYTEQELMSSTKTSDNNTSGFKPFHGKGHRLDGRGTGSTATFETPLKGDLEAEYDEEMELARAVAASLEAPQTKSEQKQDMRAKRLEALSKRGF